MTNAIGSDPKSRRRPLILIAVATAVACLAGVTARSAFATAESKPRFLSSDQSLEVLHTAFGAVAERPISEGRVVVAPTSAATSALSDEVNIVNRATNPRTGRMWAVGDTDAAWPLGIRGFTDVVTGDVYINAEFAIETTTPHEILHANVSPDVPEALGLSLYEGATEQLALDALRAAGFGVPAASEYPQERALVAEVVRIAGPALLARAYFNGGTALAELVEKIGPTALAKAKGDAAGGHLGRALATLQAVGGRA